MYVRDKEAVSRNNRKYYLENKDRKRATNAAVRQRNKDFIREIKTNNPCMDCGQKFHWFQMDFDHVTDDKVRDVGNMADRMVSLETLKKEIAKCELVCANCHRLRTFKRL